MVIAQHQMLKSSRMRVPFLSNQILPSSVATFRTQQLNLILSHRVETLLPWKAQPTHYCSLSLLPNLSRELQQTHLLHRRFSYIQHHDQRQHQNQRLHLNRQQLFTSKYTYITASIHLFLGNAYNDLGYGEYIYHLFIAHICFKHIVFIVRTFVALFMSCLSVFCYNVYILFRVQRTFEVLALTTDPPTHI